MTGRITNCEALGLVSGFGLWSLGFVVLYGGHGLICSQPVVQGELDRLVLVGCLALLIAAHLLLDLWFIRRLRDAPADLRFVRLASLVLAIAATGASVWTGVPVLTLKTC